MIGVASKTEMSAICKEAHVAVYDAAEAVAVDVDVEGCMQQSCRTMKTSSHIGFFRSLQNIKEIFADFGRKNDKKKARNSGKIMKCFNVLRKRNEIKIIKILMENLILLILCIEFYIDDMKKSKDFLN